MKTIRSCSLFRAALLLAATAILGVSAALAQSGGVTLGNSIIEPAFDDMTGTPVFIHETQKSPFPVKSNPRAAAPIYAVEYPVQSSIPAAEMDCQPTNCDHDNVIPFPDMNYGLASDDACRVFNGGNPCSQLKGVEILLGLAPTGGDFNVAWHAELVFFTAQGFRDGAIDTKITTLSQLNSALTKGDAYLLDTPITFECSPAPKQTYDRGVPEVIPYP
ncbi:MAG TPA: hypothetical protein VGI45_13485 [Terracidiphilus sp.]|jgi:hypothetical protein